MRRFLVGMVMVSIAATAPIGAFAGDSEIAQHILQKIEAEKKAGRLRGFDVSLRVDEGHVWLTGQVASQQQMQRLLYIAQHTTHLGTKQVHKQLKVAKLDRPVANTVSKKSRFPNLLTVFNREEKKEEVKPVKPVSSTSRTSLPAKPASSRLVSSRRTYQQESPALQSNQATSLNKQSTSHDVASKNAFLPAHRIRPTRQVQVARAVPATRPTPVQTPQRQVVLASNEVGTGAPQAPKPTQQAIAPAAPAPIPQNHADHVAAQLSQLNPQQLAALYQQMQMAQMQQAQAEYARLASMNQTPVAFAPAAHAPNGMGATPMAAPNYMPVSQGPAIHHDHPNMPAYAWPGYAAHPNYAAVTYPKQYSPSAWPYIGPFYPYPQVPLGWRKVQLEWDDGWWFLNFKNRHFR
jgi:hypothetical protein